MGRCTLVAARPKIGSRRLGLGQQRPHREVERFHPRAVDVQPGCAAQPARGRVDVDQIDLIHFEPAALQPRGQPVGAYSHQHHDQGERQPGPRHVAGQLAKNEVIARPDQQKVDHDQSSHQPERHEPHARETIQRAAQLAGKIVIAEVHRAGVLRLVHLAGRNVQQRGHQQRPVEPLAQRRLVEIDGQENDLAEAPHGADHQRQVGLAGLDRSAHVGQPWGAKRLQGALRLRDRRAASAIRFQGDSNSGAERSFPTFPGQIAARANRRPEPRRRAIRRRAPTARPFESTRRAP